MYSAEIKEFIREKSNLFWYTPADKKEEISPDFLVETILNYGTLEDVKRLIRLMGMKEVSRVFFNAKGRKKLNYYPQIYNFFSIYFTRNA